MKHYLGYAVKELRSSRLTSALIIIAIVMSTIMTTVVAQSITTLQTLRAEQARYVNGDYHVTFNHLNQDQVHKLQADRRISNLGLYKSLGNSTIQDSGISASVLEYNTDGLRNHSRVTQIKEGELPQRPNEIALTDNILKLMKLEPRIGMPITMKLNVASNNVEEGSFDYTGSFILSGVLEDDYTGYVSGLSLALVGEGTAERYLPEQYLLTSAEFKVKSLNAFQSTVDQIVRDLQLKASSVSYNAFYLNALGVSFDTGESEQTDNITSITVIAYVVGLLVLLASGLVIYNVLKISIVKRMKNYGYLRAIGAEPGQLYMIVILQVLIYSAIAIPVGLVIGLFTSGAITEIALTIIQPDTLIVKDQNELQQLLADYPNQNVTAILFGTVISFIFTCAASFPSASYAARVSPKTAIAGNQTTVHRKRRNSRPIKNFNRYFALINLRRNPFRSLITILSLFMSITIFVALHSFGDVLDTTGQISDLKQGDYSITSETVGIPESAMAQLQAHSGVKDISYMKYSKYMPGEIESDLTFGLSGDMLKIIGVDMETLNQLYPSMDNQKKLDFQNGALCIVKNPIEMTGEFQSQTTQLQPQDTITVNNNMLTVEAVTPRALQLQGTGWVNGVDIIVYDKVYDKLTGHHMVNQMDIFMNDSADHSQVESLIQQIVDKNPGSRWLSYQKADEQLQQSFEQIKILMWGLILFISFIGILNIMNTIYTNINTRINEIGIQRAIGMDKSSLYKIFLWEGAYYAGFASLLGSIAGYLLSVFIQSATMDVWDFSNIPIIPILLATILTGVTCLVATIIPLSSMKRMNIVESIEVVH